MTELLIDAPVLFERRTRFALGVRKTLDSDLAWLPISKATMDPPDPLMANQPVTVRAPEWLLKEKGLI